MTAPQASCTVDGCDCGTSARPIHLRAAPTDAQLDALDHHAGFCSCERQGIVTDDRTTGYATENVTPITALDREEIDALWAKIHNANHRDDGYTPACTACRRVDAVEPE